MYKRQSPNDYRHVPCESAGGGGLRKGSRGCPYPYTFTAPPLYLTEPFFPPYLPEITCYIGYILESIEFFSRYMPATPRDTRYTFLSLHPGHTVLPFYIPMTNPPDRAPYSTPKAVATLQYAIQARQRHPDFDPIAHARYKLVAAQERLDEILARVAIQDRPTQYPLPPGLAAHRYRDRSDARLYRDLVEELTHTLAYLEYHLTPTALAAIDRPAAPTVKSRKPRLAPATRPTRKELRGMSAQEKNAARLAALSGTARLPSNERPVQGGTSAERLALKKKTQAWANLLDCPNVHLPSLRTWVRKHNQEHLLPHAPGARWAPPVPGAAADACLICRQYGSVLFPPAKREAKQKALPSIAEREARDVERAARKAELQDWAKLMGHPNMYLPSVKTCVRQHNGEHIPQQHCDTNMCPICRKYGLVPFPPSSPTE